MADKNGDGSLDFDEVLKLLKTLNADVKKKYAREMFDVRFRLFLGGRLVAYALSTGVASLYNWPRFRGRVTVSECKHALSFYHLIKTCEAWCWKLVARIIIIVVLVLSSRRLGMCVCGVGVLFFLLMSR